MSTPYLGELRIFSFNFPPKGWAFCNGQTMPINQNQALFAVIGIFYGGNGTTTFNLPNLQGKIPFHTGNGLVVGQTGGESAHMLITQEMPQHNHLAMASPMTANLGNPTGNLWAAGDAAYSPTSNTTMNSSAILAAGGSQPHDNMPPYLTISICIALQGIFPSQN